MGYSDADGKNAQLRFKNNQEMTQEELIQRQKDMNNYVWNNDKAVDQAIDEHDKAIQDLQKSFDPPKLLFDRQNNII